MVGGQISKVQTFTASAAAALDALRAAPSGWHSHYRWSTSHINLLKVHLTSLNTTDEHRSDTFTALLDLYTGNKGEFNPLTRSELLITTLYLEDQIVFRCFGSAFIEL